MQFKFFLLAIALFQGCLAVDEGVQSNNDVDIPSNNDVNVPSNNDVPSVKDEGVQTETTTKTSWVKKGVNMVTGMIKGQADIAKDAVGMAGSGTHMGAEITSAAGKLGTGIGNAALQGGLQVGAMGLEAGTNLAHQGIGLMDKWGNLLPGIIGKGVQSVAGLADKIVDKAEDIGKGIIGNIGTAGDKGFKWVDKTIEGTAGYVDSAVNKATSSVQKQIDTGANKITGGIDDTLGKLQNMVDNIKAKPVTA